MPETVIKLPQLGESVAEGTIGRWLKQPGDRVERDEPLVEIQTDKVNAEIPSPVAGVLQAILQPEGVTVAVHAEIAVIGDGPGAAPEPSAQPSFTYDSSPGRGGVVSSSASEAVSEDDSAKRFYTPVVLRIARERDLDLGAIEGTGLNGRVTRKDVERAISTGAPATPREAPGKATPAARPEPRRAADVASEVSPLTPMRRAIARHMEESRSTIPDAWTLVEVDVTRLVRLRASVLDDWQAREGFELTFLPFMLKAVLAGLRSVPEMNASWNPDGSGVVLHPHYNLGVAVSVEGGLIVPVLRDADQFSVGGLARKLRELVVAARGGKLSPDDFAGATFTVNNPGALGSVMSQPIIPVGQSAIVTMEAIVKRPVVLTDAEGNEGVAIRRLMNMCLSFDHRVLDGAQALSFLKVVRESLEATNFTL